MIYIFIITYIAFIIMNSYIFNKKMNFVNLIITLWTSISILSMFGFYNMYVPNNKAYIFILCFIFAFEFFSIFFNKVLKIKKEEIKNELEDKIDYRKHNVILIFLICIMSVFAMQGLKIMSLGGSFSNIRDAYLNCENFSNELQMFISLIIVPLGNAVGIYAAIDCVNKKKITSTLILYLLFLGEHIIYTGGRGIILNIALIVVLALMDKYNNNIVKIIKENKPIVCSLLAVVLILGIITLQRNLQGKGLFYNIYCYSAGSIHLLGEYIKNPERYLLTKDDLLYGQILISGFTYPITFIFRLIGFNIKAGVYTFYETTQNFVPISPNTTINNSVTVIGYALRDFGLLGIFIYVAIITFVYTYLYKNKQQKNNILNKAIYYFFIKCSIFLFSDFQFANTGTIITFIYFILLNKFCNVRVSQKNEQQNNNKVLVLRKNKDDIFFKYIKNINIETYYNTSTEKMFFRLFRKIKLPLFYMYLGDWTNSIKDYDKIIMFDNGFNNMIAKYVKRKNNNIKVVLWYWNPIFEYSEKFLKCKYVDEFWTYNKTDSQKYNINYNTQFYTEEVKLENSIKKNDVVFLGAAKNRKNELIEIEDKLKNKNIKTKFNIIENEKDYISYEKYLDFVKESKCILDYNMNNNDALTLRPLEALFLERKLITNNKNIINYDFYNSKNIFILGKDDINKINEFIESEYQAVDEEIIKYYDYKQWIKRF